MRKARILMVEDEADVLALNRRHFEAQGYEVYCVATLGEARTCIYETPPDLILLDVMLPDGSGYDFCAEIRRLTAVPIIYLTIMGRDEDTVRGLLAGGDDYVAKPFNLDVLSARVMAALRRGGFTTAGRIEKPPLVIDLMTGRVTLNDSEIALTQKEMQLLGLLVCNAGQEFSADELYNAIWGPGSSPGTVRSHISNLRKKIADGGEYFEIMMTPGRGYTFVRTQYTG